MNTGNRAGHFQTVGHFKVSDASKVSGPHPRNINDPDTTDTFGHSPVAYRRTGHIMPRTNRPHVVVRPYEWRTGTDALPGIALTRYGRPDSPLAHLTPTEARRLADRLHDLADDLERDAAEHLTGDPS